MTGTGAWDVGSDRTISDRSSSFANEAASRVMTDNTGIILSSISAVGPFTSSYHDELLNLAAWQEQTKYGCIHSDNDFICFQIGTGSPRPIQQARRELNIISAPPSAAVAAEGDG